MAVHGNPPGPRSNMKTEIWGGHSCPQQLHIDETQRTFHDLHFDSMSLRTKTSAIHFAAQVADFRSAVLDGLSAAPKTLPCRFLYDDNGSRLFEEICQLQEYYLTRTEISVLETHIGEIAALCGSECLLVELGSGSSKKTRLLLDHLTAPVAYVPIDIAREQLRRTTLELSAEYPCLEVIPFCRDYNNRWELPVPARPPQRTVTFFPGSTIGNLEPEQAQSFLERLALQSEYGDGLLIGVDLCKASAILEAAYNDCQGVTAAFNLNLLRRINRELDADFNLSAFRHRAVYNQRRSRIEMHLISLSDQIVECCGESLQFAGGEHITTEHSYKYSIEGFENLAEAAGFEMVRSWTDPRKWFAVFYLGKRSKS